MRSSGSTPSRSPEPRFPLFLWIVGDDHPRACTGRRLARVGLVRTLDPRRSAPAGLLLDPHVPEPLSPEDRRLASAGISAVDCSWNRLGYLGRYPPGPLDAVPERRRRRLPYLLAGNPQHYGRLNELNTVEALAAALVVVGERGRAEELLGRVGAGGSFLELNAKLLSSYASAGSAEGIRSVELEFF